MTTDSIDRDSLIRTARDDLIGKLPKKLPRTVAPQQKTSA